MRFEHVCLESIAVALPEEVWTSAEIEERLRPLYERLRLPFGRLELMSGIRERRFWPPGTRPSDASAAAGRAALAQSALSPEQIEAFMHAAVCRDMLEPATAAFAHRKIGLSANVQIFDVSNACLGFLNSLTILAAMIESGQIRCGMVVAGENGRPLVERTLQHLATAPLDRNQIKPYFANLTIGSGAAAAIVCHRSLVHDRPHRLRGGICLTATKHSELCQGDAAGGDGMEMQTNSEQLLVAGVEVAQRAWAAFQKEMGWVDASVDRFVCHQVGAMHRRRLYEALGVDPARDFSTFETLGNMGSVSLPATLVQAVESGAVVDGNRVALLGIGSGINCMMLALEW
jgi:3-oxoacyl-[acyl-carrier-protein] synthase-3